MLKTECRMLFEIGFVSGDSEVAEGGLDEAGAVFASDGLPRRQFVAQAQQLLHLRHNPSLFGKGGQRSDRPNDFVLGEIWLSRTCALVNELLFECPEENKKVAVKNTVKTGAGADCLIGSSFYSEDRNLANRRSIHRKQYIAGLVKPK